MYYNYSKLTWSILLLISLITFSCEEDENATNNESVLISEAVNNYANIVLANYTDALNDAKTLQTAINTFVDAPSDANLTAAKNAWLQSRESYGQSEAFRFYGGPIDDEDGPEGQLNAWPLDESYIDYVTVSANGGDANDGTNIINDPSTFPTIDKTVIASLNEQGGETNVSSGYHAIEFLLWGQDVSTGAGGGERPYTDYVTGGSGTNSNQDRRGQYLKALAELLVDDLQSLVDKWAEGGNYRSFFTSEAELNNSLERILNSLGKLSKGELAGERMFVAWDLRSKEDEHSCFSDNTHRDIVTNAKGIENVYLGQYGSISGTGIYDVIAVQNPTLAEEIKTLMRTSVTSAELIEAPFDQEFLAEPGRTRIQTTFTTLRDQGDKIAEAAALFGFTVDPEDI